MVRYPAGWMGVNKLKQVGRMQMAHWVDGEPALSWFGDVQAAVSTAARRCGWMECELNGVSMVTVLRMNSKAGGRQTC